MERDMTAMGKHNLLFNHPATVIKKAERRGTTMMKFTKITNINICIKDITFPDFEENYYYNGMKQNSRTGSLEDYILRQDGNIKRNSSNLNVLNSFDNAFSEVFDYMGTIYQE